MIGCRCQLVKTSDWDTVSTLVDGGALRIFLAALLTYFWRGNLHTPKLAQLEVLAIDCLHFQYLQTLPNIFRARKEHIQMGP